MGKGMSGMSKGSSKGSKGKGMSKGSSKGSKSGGGGGKSCCGYEKICGGKRQLRQLSGTGGDDCEYICVEYC